MQDPRKKELEKLIQNIDQVIKAFLFAHRIPVTRMDGMRQAAYNQKASCSVEDACTWLSPWRQKIWGGF